jgi:hypothetical protein
MACARNDEVGYRRQFRLKCRFTIGELAKLDSDRDLILDSVLDDASAQSAPPLYLFLLDLNGMTIGVSYYKRFAEPQLIDLIHNHARRNKVNLRGN